MSPLLEVAERNLQKIKRNRKREIGGIIFSFLVKALALSLGGVVFYAILFMFLAL